MARILLVALVMGASVASGRAPCACAPDPIARIPIVLVDGNNVAKLVVGDVLLKTIIDTGGHREVGITPAALRTLDVRFTGSKTIRTDGGGARFSGREFVIPTLELGGFNFFDVRGFERNESADGNFGGAPYEAVVGRDFLSRFVVVVDYHLYHTIDLYPHDAGRSVCGPHVIELRRNSQGLWYSRFDVKGRQLNLAWDTGATYSFIKPKSFSLLPDVAADGTRTADLRFGRMRHQKVEFVGLDLPGVKGLDGLLGFNFFETHRVCFDFDSNAVSVL